MDRAESRVGMQLGREVHLELWRTEMQMKRDETEGKEGSFISIRRTEMKTENWDGMKLSRAENFISIFISVFSCFHPVSTSCSHPTNVRSTHIFISNCHSVDFQKLASLCRTPWDDKQGWNWDGMKLVEKGSFISVLVPVVSLLMWMFCKRQGC